MQQEKDRLMESAWQAMQQKREADALALLLTLPLTPVVHHELSLCLYNLGEITDSMAHNVAAIAGGVGEKAIIFRAVALPQCPSASPEAVLAARLSMGRLYPAADRKAPAGDTEISATPLRMGFFSSYFHDPGWMKPVWGLINALDRAECRIFLYSDAGGTSFRSGYTRKPTDAARDTSTLDATDCADCMRIDSLDVLIDLNGHSQAQRMEVLQLRPARFTVGWFNYYATSGMAGMDALIADDIVAPPGVESGFSERLIRLPQCYLTFDVNYPVPPVSPQPCAMGHPFTWGCLTALYKLTPPVIAAWSRLLHGRPDSRLLVKNGGLATPSNREHLQRRFAAHGISKDRLILEGPAAHFAFLEAYGRVDIQLDPWPYTGGTTTSESLWQGVPVLTRTGPRWIERVSHSLLHSAGMAEWVAGDESTWLEKALHWSAPEQLPELAALRAGLRTALSASALCDTHSLALQMLAALKRESGSQP